MQIGKVLGKKDKDEIGALLSREKWIRTIFAFCASRTIVFTPQMIVFK
jgi:hypothetical protein